MAKYAKSRKHKKAGRRRHRRVGAMALSLNSPLMKIGLAAAAALTPVGDKINALIDKPVAGKLDEKILGAVQGGVGYLLAFKGKANPIKTIAGALLLGSGVRRELKAMGVISGYGAVPVVGGRVNGYGRVPVVGGYTGGYTPSTMPAGALNGYTVPNAPRNVVGSFENDGSGSGISADSRN